MILCENEHRSGDAARIQRFEEQGMLLRRQRTTYTLESVPEKT